MTTKKEAIEFAKKLNWTAKDAERAFKHENLKKATEKDLLLILANFAGPELASRQRLQAAQKAQVTQKKKFIKQIETEYVKQIEEGHKKIKEMNSIFLPIIEHIYNFAKPFGLNDPWIEATLIAYHEQNSPNQQEDKVVNQ